MWPTIQKNVAYLQAYGCRFCLHIGSWAFVFGSGIKGRGPRLEILTPCRWFRWSRGYREQDRPFASRPAEAAYQAGLKAGVAISREHFRAMLQTFVARMDQSKKDYEEWRAQRADNL